MARSPRPSTRWATRRPRYYDGDGEVTESIDPMGHVTTTYYDADGEVTETIDAARPDDDDVYDADGEVTEYDRLPGPYHHHAITTRTAR